MKTNDTPHRGRPIKEDKLEGVNVRLDPDTLRWYNQKAIATGQPRSHLLQTAINLYMEICITIQEDPVSPTIKNLKS